MWVSMYTPSNCPGGGRGAMLTLAQLQAMHEADPDAGLLERFSWLCVETTPRPPALPVWEWPAALADGRIPSHSDLFDARFEIQIFGADARADFSLNELARLYGCSPLQVPELYTICHRRGALQWNAEQGVMEELQPVRQYIVEAADEFRRFLASSNGPVIQAGSSNPLQEKLS